MTKAITIYQISYPENVNLYLSEVRKIVDLDDLKPNNLIKIFKPDLTFDDIINDIKDSFKSNAEK